MRIESEKRKSFAPWTLVMLVMLSFLLYLGFVRVFEPEYLIKSLGKFFIFAIILFIDWKFFRKDVLKNLLESIRPKQINWNKIGLICIIGSALLLVTQLLYRPISQFFEIDSAVSEIIKRTDNTRIVVIAALFYIPTINAWVEEVFFRGFLCLELCRRLSNRTGNIVSAVLFAIYHLTLMRSWFSLPIFIAVMGGLFAAGLILNRFVIKDRHIWRAWLIHAWFNIIIISITFHFYPA